MRRLAAVFGALLPLLVPAPAAAVSEPYCEAFGEFGEVTSTVNVAVLAAEEAQAQDPSAPHPDQVQAEYLVILSPKLESLSDDLSHGGAKIVNRSFRRYQDVFARGVRLLRREGLTKKHIRTLRRSEVTTVEADLAAVLGDANLSDADVSDVARRFAPSLQTLSDIQVEERIAEAFGRTGRRCRAVLDPGN